MAHQLNVIIGSTRPSRISPVVARWVEEAAREHGKFAVNVVDLAAFNLPLLDEVAQPRLQQYAHEHTKAWSESVGAADAYVFVTPEYDYFPPAALINAVQVLAVEWSHKPAGIVSYGGVSGGLRAAQVLRQLLSGLNVHVPGSAGTVPIPMFLRFIGEAGVFGPNEAAARGLMAMLDEIAGWSVALKTMQGSPA